MLEWIVLICRILVAGNFLIFGLNGFIPFLSPPPQTPEMKKAAAALVSIRFVFPAVKVIEVLCGLLLLLNFCPILALTLLLPIVFGITALQMLFNRRLGYGITVFTLVPYLILLMAESKVLMQLFLQNTL